MVCLGVSFHRAQSYRFLPLTRFYIFRFYLPYVNVYVNIENGFWGFMITMTDMNLTLYEIVAVVISENLQQSL